MKGKIFATLPPGGELVVLKLLPEVKERLQHSDPEAVIPLPGGWDRGGWTQIVIGSIDREKLAELVRHAWRRVAPKTLLRHGAEG